MKKTKLQLNRTTIQRLSSDQAADIHGGATNTSSPCLTSACSNRCPTVFCHSIVDSCFNTDCCLMPTDG